MISRLFFWLKQEIGFSRKESRGFLILVPLLFGMSLLPLTLTRWQASQADQVQASWIEWADSLRQIGFSTVSNSWPLQVPADTGVATSSGLRKLPFSEADSVLLQIVPGIGPALASRIIKYQVSLGGFHSQTQLLEVYGMKQEVSARIWDFFVFDKKIRPSLQINSAEVGDLAGHPYISYGQAKVIVAYRKQHGDFSKAEDLAGIKLFDPAWIARIKPYLVF